MSIRTDIDKSREKVLDIFRELVGERASQLSEAATPSDVISVIAEALSTNNPKNARELAYHIVDWGAEAAFVVAVLLYPERFTGEEIRAGVVMVMTNAGRELTLAAELKSTDAV